MALSGLRNWSAGQTGLALALDSPAPMSLLPQAGPGGCITTAIHTPAVQTSRDSFTGDAKRHEPTGHRPDVILARLTGEKGWTEEYLESAQLIVEALPCCLVQHPSIIYDIVGGGSGLVHDVELICQRITGA